MAYRIALHTCEWLAVSAATALLALAIVDATAVWIVPVGLALICANAARGIAFRRASGLRLDAVLQPFLAEAPGRPANDDGGAA